MTATARAVPKEHAEQVRVCRWFALQHRKHAGALVAIPNAGKRSHALAKRMKSEGMQAGVLDLCLRIPRRGYAGLWIEMKRRHATRAEVSDEQYADIGYLLRNGYAATWCAGADEAIQTITEYLTEAA